jgi:hypothetical protein
MSRAASWSALGESDMKAFRGGMREVAVTAILMEVSG